jgi:hypothetical protein
MGKSGDVSRSRTVFTMLEADAAQLIAALQIFADAGACAS